MTAERHARAKAAFLEACALPPEARRAFLHRACAGDPALLAEVESLLAYHDDAPGPTGVSGPGDDERGTSAGRFETGALLAGRFRIVSLLGRGGMGEVYRADDVTLGQRVALKFLPAAAAADQEALSRIYREARLAREVTHPNVCRVYDIGEHDGEVFISMEYVDGADLGSLLRRVGRLSPAKAGEISRQICEGLAAVHARGVVHRDLKPGNVMIDGRGQARLADFGIASLEHARAEASGTPAYMAPELLQGGAATVQSDIYALGVLLYEIHAAQYPFTDGGRNTVRPLSDVTGEIDPAVDMVIRQCLDRDPEKRPRSAAAVASVFAAPDPLAAAIAAGQTPSPEAVAASQLRGRTVSPLLAWGALAVFIVGLASLLALTGDTFHLSRTGLTTRPAVLTDRARTVLREVGAPTDGGSHAEGLVAADSAVDAMKPLLYWYRSSRDPLVPRDVRNVFWGFSAVDIDDPPDGPGTSKVILDPAGHLVLMAVVPPASGTGGAPPSAAAPASWASVFELAGLAIDRFAPAEPTFTPPFFADARYSWTGPDPDDASVTLHVDGASWMGRPAFFAVREWTHALDKPPVTRYLLFLKLSDIQLFVLLIAAIPIARSNFTHGRVDRSGALVLSVFVLAARLVTWSMRATHVPDWNAELDLFFAAAAAALLEAARVWLFYVALEPQVRRLWPQLLISWNRLMSGRLRDPILGRDVAIGAAIGVCYMLLLQVDSALPGWLGLDHSPAVIDPSVIVSTLGTRGQFATLVEVLIDAIYDAVTTVMFLVLFRAIVRRPWAAAVAFFAGTAFLTTLEGSNLAVSWLTLGLLVGGLTTFALLRFGLVTALTATFVSYLLQSYPLTLEFSSWYVEASVFALVAVTAVAAFGTLTAARPQRARAR